MTNAVATRSNRHANLEKLLKTTLIKQNLKTVKAVPILTDF